MAVPMGRTMGFWGSFHGKLVCQIANPNGVVSKVGNAIPSKKKNIVFPLYFGCYSQGYPGYPKKIIEAPSPTPAHCWV